MLIDENRWRAHRYGIDEGLIDFGREKIIPYTELFEEMLSLIHEDAEALGCVKAVEHGRENIKRGTSAYAQIEQYHKAISEGGNNQEALKSVVEMLVINTISH